MKICYKIKNFRKNRFPGHGGIGFCATQFGVHEQQWRNWEDGKRTPNASTRQKLAEFMGVSITELNDETKSMENPVDTTDEKGVDYWRGQADVLKEENERLRQELDASRAEIIRLHKENGILQGKLEAALEKPASIRRSIGSA